MLFPNILGPDREHRLPHEAAWNALGWMRQGPLRRVKAASDASTVDYASMAATYTVQRASRERLRDVFLKYASVEKKGEMFMNSNDFVRKFLGMYPEENYNRNSVDVIASAADTTKDGLISFEEFSAFEAILCHPEALYLTVFEMFDKDSSELVSFEEFKRMISKTSSVINMPFDFDSTFIKLYFGKNKHRLINYQEFCQLLHDFHREQGRHAFRSHDKNNEGYITSLAFVDIMTQVMPHMLSKLVRENLLVVAGGAHSQKVSFPWYLAFNEMLTQIELLKRIFLSISKGNLQLELTLDEFMQASQAYAQVTPLAIHILYHLADLRHPGRGTMNFQDLERIDPERLKRVTQLTRITNLKLVEKPADRGFLIAMMENAYRFTLGSIAGACGATAVYPIDLVKTRMQNQRTGSMIGEIMYKNSFDCFSKVVRHEGLRGLYRGLVPQLVGVAPEKAIKLTTNDFVRDKLSFQGKIPLWAEIVAGGCGGASQVLFTNPLEIVKIRLQVAGEIQAGPRVSVFSVMRDLGMFGLYKGARACFLRDIPFSAIYFPTYAHAKLATADENGMNGPATLFASAFIAGVPAAALVTPADVIKTRLQVAARAGQTTYSGVIDCYRKLVREEGFSALWKGSVARVFRSSPQFAVTLLTYELLQRVFYVDFGGSRPTGSESSAHKTLLDRRSTNPDHVGGYQLAEPTFATAESKFGLYLPRFQPSGAAA